MPHITFPQLLLRTVIMEALLSVPIKRVELLVRIIRTLPDLKKISLNHFRTFTQLVSDLFHSMFVNEMSNLRKLQHCFIIK